jgi:hypothetical protein
MKINLQNPVNRILLLALVAIPKILPAQDYWQQELHYDIQVSLNDSAHQLNGIENIEYLNNSPDTLSFIWFHLWPNAYKNKNTAYYKQLMDLGSLTHRQRVNKENGYIDSLYFSVDKKPAITEPDPKNIDVVRLILPDKLFPGRRIHISTPFRVKIPPYFSRLGYERSTFMISQWYPKPAVYDRKGWHEFPYLDQGEFYSEFGSFDVKITVPSSFVVGATGQLQNAAEREEYIRIGRLNLSNPASLLNYRPEKGISNKTLEFRADSVHDFAWFASPGFLIQYDSLRLASGRRIDVFSFSNPGDENWRKSISFMKDAVLHYSSWIGEYGYPIVSAVEGPGNPMAGGMEYPMITLISGESGSLEQFDDVITHEVGHNWFYGILGSNEREHPWMDEGVNTYYEYRYEAEKYKNNTSVGMGIAPGLLDLSADDVEAGIYRRINQISTNRSIENPATAFDSEMEYAIIVYNKTALWMYLLERFLGKEKLNRGMHAYYLDWRFKHPYPEDMERSMEMGTGTHLKTIFDLLHTKGTFK